MQLHVKEEVASETLLTSMSAIPTSSRAIGSSLWDLREGERSAQAPAPLWQRMPLFLPTRDIAFQAPSRLEKGTRDPARGWHSAAIVAHCIASAQSQLFFFRRPRPLRNDPPLPSLPSSTDPQCHSSLFGIARHVLPMAGNQWSRP